MDLKSTRGVDGSLGGNLKTQNATVGCYVGYRFNSYSSNGHTNVSAFAEYNEDSDNKTNSVLGAKYEINDGSKSMFIKSGVQNDQNGMAPVVGIGARIALTY